MGGHGHGHGNGSGPHYPEGVTMPPWERWSKIDGNYPELEAYQRRLAKKGLKDPFIRDYAWAFDKRVVKPWDPYRAIFFGFWGGLGVFGAIWFKKTFFPVKYDTTVRYPLLREMQDRDFQ